jgi:hypothetical protein
MAPDQQKLIGTGREKLLGIKAATALDLERVAMAWSTSVAIGTWLRHSGASLQLWYWQKQGGQWRYERRPWTLADVVV